MTIRAAAGLWLAAAAIACGQATIVVTSDAELRAAAAASGRGDTTIVIRGTIKTPGGIAFPTTQAALTIMGDKTTATLQFVDQFAGKWGSPQAVMNGLELAGGNCTLYGLTLRDYNNGGSAIKYHGAGALLVSHVSFFDCAALWWPPLASPPASASDAWYNQVIGSHGNAASIVITGCQFARCALSQWTWTHCIYVSAKYVGIVDNTFDGCGNPFSVGNNGFAWTQVIIGNKLLRPAATKANDGTLRPAYFAALTPLGQTVYARNQLAGLWAYPWTGHPRAYQAVDWNDYSQMTVAGYWAADTGAGRTMGIDEWHKLGLDQNSAGPK